MTKRSWSFILPGLDCYTFFETTLVLSRCIKKGKTTFADYQNELLIIRYRNGVLSDYASRLHYTSDWIYDNEQRGIVENVTCKIGGVKYDNEVSFMSEHPQSYKRLKDNPDLIEKIRLMELEVNSREHYYIPQEKIADVEAGIQNGDIIGITTDINGLDVSHTGMAIRMEDGRIHLLHAPMAGKKIQITESPLADYIKNNKRQTGIIVARVLEPEQN